MVSYPTDAVADEKHDEAAQDRTENYECRRGAREHRDHDPDHGRDRRRQRTARKYAHSQDSSGDHARRWSGRGLTCSFVASAELSEIQMGHATPNNLARGSRLRLAGKAILRGPPPLTLASREQQPRVVPGKCSLPCAARRRDYSG